MCRCPNIYIKTQVAASSSTTTLLFTKKLLTATETNLGSGLLLTNRCCSNYHTDWTVSSPPVRTATDPLICEAKRALGSLIMAVRFRGWLGIAIHPASAVRACPASQPGTHVASRVPTSKQDLHLHLYLRPFYLPLPIIYPIYTSHALTTIPKGGNGS
jgi:hypothetical protein